MLKLAYFLLAASLFETIFAKELSLESLGFKPSPETPGAGRILTFSGSRVLVTCGISKVSCSRRKLSKAYCQRFRCCWNEELSTCTKPTYNIIKLQTTCGEGLGDPPKCGPITCPALELPANGASLICSHPTKYGSVCNHICDVGHTPSTAADVTCSGDGSTMNGNWEPSQPDCDLTQCASPVAVTGSEYDCVGGINYGETCDVICAAGYTGAFTMNCDQHTTNAGTSSWDDTTPCTITSCSSPSDVVGSTYDCSGDVNYGGTCGLTCDAGYTGEKTANCNQHTYNAATSDWDDASPCELTSCASPSAVTGSTFDCTGDVNYGGTCDLTCDAGYIGAKTLTCNQHTSNAATSTWDDDSACTITACASPSAVTGSSFSCSGDVNYGGTCDLTCDSGYEGARTLNCNQHTAGAATSTWDDDSACTPIVCASPSAVTGSTFDCTGDVSAGDTCALTCDAGYTGARTLNCGATGDWDDESPCTITVCASPSAVTGSTFSCTGDVNYGGTCTLTCDAGYAGDKTLNCDQHTSGAATSSWDDDSACTITSCASPADVTGSTFSCSGDVNYGGTCDLTCGSADYSGARTLNCNQHTSGDSTSSWDDDTPCLLTACVVPPSVDLMFVNDESGSVYYSNYQLTKQFMADVAAQLKVPIDSGDTIVGAVTFGTSPRYPLQMAPYSYDTLRGLLLGLDYADAFTYAGEAVVMAHEKINADGRADKTKVMVIITDGASSDDPVPPANAARDEGILILVVGVSGYDYSQILGIAGGDASLVKTVSNFNDIFGVSAEIATLICQADD